MKILSLFTKGLLIWALWMPFSSQAQLSSEQHATLVEDIRQLGRKNIRYRQYWRPPGETKPWLMDCSNTVKYIFKKSLNVQLPRTASSQYWELSQKGRVTKAPLRKDRSVDTKSLLSQLRSGDLLFWEWTYDIKRSPPITHVMIYLGRTAEGIPKMAGCTTRSRGEITRAGGVDIYTFNPNVNMGGVRSFFGGYKRKARFVGFGRPHVTPSKSSHLAQN